MNSSDESMRLADKLSDEGRYRDALMALQSAIKEYPFHAHLWAKCGWCLCEMGSYEQAIIHFSEALRIKPGGATTHYFRAQCYEKVGKLDLALLDYKQSVTISPAADAFVNIGLIHKFSGQRESAIQALIKACELEPENDTMKAILAGIYGQFPQSE